MDARLIQTAAKFCGWEECHTGAQTWYEFMPENEPSCVVAGVDYITAHGCESIKAALRKRDICYDISWDGRKHTVIIPNILRQAPTEADALALALAALEQEDGK